MRDSVKHYRRLVIKVGSALVTQCGAKLDKEMLTDWARQIHTLRRQNNLEIIFVSSGAIAIGIQRLQWPGRPAELPRLQAAAAVGQTELIKGYEDAFLDYDTPVAQILLTHQDLSDRERYLNARATLNTLVELGVIPIINENDTIVTDEIKFGDNDTLGALVANLTEADALIILTDQEGLYTADPRHDPAAALVHEGCATDPCYERMAGGAGSSIGKGGMLTKTLAARRAARSGAHTYIASGHQPDVLLRLMQGEQLGTLLYSTSTRLAARKQWLADHLKLAGALVIDDGAVMALRQGRSLLPIGVVEVRGEFQRGTVVACMDYHNEEIGRGLINYSSEECQRIARHTSSDIQSILGYVAATEVIHRNNMIIKPQP